MATGVLTNVLSALGADSSWETVTSTSGTLKVKKTGNVVCVSLSDGIIKTTDDNTFARLDEKYRPKEHTSFVGACGASGVQRFNGVVTSGGWIQINKNSSGNNQNYGVFTCTYLI